MGDGNASDGQPFGHLEPDVASADDEGGLGSDPVDNGMQPKRAPEILFACVHNAGHSQMAAEVSHAMKEAACIRMCRPCWTLGQRFRHGGPERPQFGLIEGVKNVG